MKKLRIGSRVGKYRIQGRLGAGGFSEVFTAFDTVEGLKVALKVPHANMQTKEMLDLLHKEVRLTSKLEHPSILRIKNADVIDGRLVVAYPLGEETLHERMTRRLSTAVALDYGEQLLHALSYAHSKRVIHCDVKPENLILFPDHRLRLTDFGISKIAVRTVVASGSGTVGYMAPEQAMGRPSFRSDVFSAALVIYRMLAGVLPDWPYRWPLPGNDRLRRSVPQDMCNLLKRGLQVDQRRRYASAEPMHTAYVKLLPAAGRFLARKKRKRNGR